MCYGTRPQVIKAAALIEPLQRSQPLLTIDTGQHYDYEMNRVFYEQLGVPEPVYCLEARHDAPAEQLSRIIARAAEVFAREQPWAAVVIGDTNSTLGCALAAAQLRIPVIHVEAGLRAANPLMLEEINRRMVDAIAMLLCTPSDSATARLQSENVSGTIVQTGDVARDVLVRLVAQAPALGALDWWPVVPGTPFVFATLHRAELTSSAELVRQAIDALGCLGVPVVLPAHPRLRMALRDFGLMPHIGRSIHVLEPLGYLEAVACLREASLVVTDSGGIQREAYWLGTPCITLRSETEWTETVALGANTLVAPDSIGTTLASVVRPLLQENHDRPRWNRDAYGTGYAAHRIGEAIQRFADVL